VTFAGQTRKALRVQVLDEVLWYTGSALSTCLFLL
jgi:hypothetical protein